ncbi:MAG: AAA family ATPase [Actinomycetia bacterium]|nr:AAA family ATPase [Actinomycetes bacterium]
MSDAGGAAHPEHQAEQAYLHLAHDMLERMLEQVERVLESEQLAGQEFDSEVARAHLEARRRSLAVGSGPLCFGRIDHDVPVGSDPELWYVGRRHVEDEDGDPVVVDWRASVAVPFYRATWSDPQGLERRRRFSVEDRDLLDLLDEGFTDPDGAATGLGGGVPDPLLAELGRARTGQMRDIVATIQAEQDQIIRAPLDELVIVQGGPGTGKTAVGLHRAAFLLFEHRDLLDRERVLVVGPNRVFLNYISQVLPSLGESAVVQATIEALVAVRWPVRATEPEDRARLKGDARMAEVIERSCLDRIQVPDDGIEARVGTVVVRIGSDELNELVAEAAARQAPFEVRRNGLRQRLTRLAHRRWTERTRGEQSVEWIEAQLRDDRAYQRKLAQLWPNLSAPAVVRRLFSNKAARKGAAADLLTSDEQALLQRSPAKKVSDEMWAAADIPLLDEAEGFLSGTTTTYGHLVVDEAQDLSPMAYRMLGRRTPRRSMTVLGDLAQATTPAARTSWDDVLGDLGNPDHAQKVELGVGYRLSEPILAYANRLLPEAAPDVRPSTSVRVEGPAPLVIEEGSETLLERLVAITSEAAQDWATVGVVAPDALLAAVGEALNAGGLTVARAGHLGDHGAVTVLGAHEVKGLEFDAVIVTEPGLIYTQGHNGARLLYVALTRAVQQLVVLHAQPLPPVLVG